MKYLCKSSSVINVSRNLTVIGCVNCPIRIEPRDCSTIDFMRQKVNSSLEKCITKTSITSRWLKRGKQIMMPSLSTECQQLLISGYVLGNLSLTEAMLVEEILRENPEAQQQLIELQQAWEETYCFLNSLLPILSKKSY